MYVVLTANEGNVKRTARETEIPESTIRRWRDEWEKNGPPSVDSLEIVAGDFVDEAKGIRALGLSALKGKLELLVKNPKDVNVAQVTTLVGILTDKIDRAAGLLPSGAQGNAPALDRAAIRELLVGYTQAMQNLSEQREAEIIEAEIVEQPALPSGK